MITGRLRWKWRKGRIAADGEGMVKSAGARIEAVGQDRRPAETIKHIDVERGVGLGWWRYEIAKAPDDRSWPEAVIAGWTELGSFAPSFQS